MKQNFKLFLLTVLGIWMAGSAWAEEHYLVGGCTDSGWNTGSYHRLGVAMQKINSDTWVWYGKLTVGEGDNGRFKIPDGIGSWDGYWAPSQGTVLTSDWSDLSTNGGGDYKFCVSEEGLYKVTINTTTKKIKAEKLTNEPSKDGDYYLIGSVADFCWFAAYIATNETNASKARLTADLDFSTDGFFPLASDKHKFKGEIDGAGHTLKGINVTEDYGFIALIRYAAGGAYVHDLIIDGSFSGGRKVAGVIGWARDGGEVRLTNVINKANVTATAGTNGDEGNAAGLVACAGDGTKIIAENCANMGEIHGQSGQCAGLAGWTQSGTTFTNCWNSGNIYDMENNCNLYRNSTAVTATNCFDANGADFYAQGTKVANSTIATGEFCYVLNGDQSSINWYQNLSGTVDEFPVPFASHAQVYANGELKCDGTSAGGELVYSNSSTSDIPPHTFTDGWCSVCGTLDHNYLTADGEGFYSIATTNQLKWFSEVVADVNQSAKAKLTADIDYTAHKQGFIGVSQSKAFGGVFDGQGHSITIDIVNINNGRTGLFSYINAATIKNLVVKGSATSAGNNCVGGLGGRSDGDGTLIENVVVETAVSYTGTNNDATCGGFFANMEGKVTLKNCAFYGSINTGTAEGNGGLVGWAGSGANNKYINCIVAPSSYTKNGNSAEYARNSPSTTNCYYEAGDDARLATGEMAYVMNEAIGEIVWFQKIGTDTHPMPFGSDVVYANGYQYCDGTVKSGSYENENKGTVRDDHNFSEWGFCTNKNGSDVTCDEIQPDFVTLTDGFYQIGNAKELNWFAVWTNRKDATVNAKLTADIDMSEVDNFPGIGSGEKNFTGTFDGQRHIISNMKMNWDREGVGLVNRAANGATVKNVTIAADCSFKGSKAVAGLIGGAYGTGDIYIENCGNEGAVETTGQNAGGIVGVCFNNGGMIAHLTNVYNVGEITGATANESGSLSGWMTNAVLKNVYSIAGYPTSEKTHGFQQGNQFARGNGINLTNCYDYGTGDWGQNNGSWGSCFVAGAGKIAEVTESEMARIFVGLYNAEAGNVWRMEYDGWAHPVLYGEDQLFIVHESANNNIVNTTKNVKLYRTIKTEGTWNTFCVPFDISNDELKAAFGDDVEVAEFSETADGENSTVNFTKMGTASVKANVPVLLKSSTGEKVFSFNNRTIQSGDAIVAGSANFDFVGSYNKETVVPENDYYLSDNKIFKSLGNGSTISATRAYIKTKDGSNARIASFFIDGEGQTTGIVNAKKVETKDYYNLNGQRVDKAQMRKGLYIRDGRKMVVK